MSVETMTALPTSDPAPARSTSAIHARGVTKTFVAEGGRSVDAVTGIDLDIPDGEFVCLVGPSGHGKTTLLMLVAGLIDPTAGQLTVHGKSVTGPGADRGLIFQQDTLFLWRRVEDNVAYGLEARGIGRSERDAIVREYLRLVGLTSNARSWPKELSGGMRKRVQVATVFANNPDVLLMDEPFGSLDYVQRTHLHDVLLDLWTRTKKTILFVTHDVDEAITLADRIVVVVEGRVADDIPVPFPRPRTEELRATADAIEMRKRMLRHLGISVSETQRLRARVDGDPG